MIQIDMPEIRFPSPVKPIRSHGWPFVLALFTITLFGSCAKEFPNTSSPQTLSSNRPLNGIVEPDEPEPNYSFGTLGILGSTTIPTYGPRPGGEGWKGIIISLEGFRYYGYTRPDFNSAKSAGYYPIIGQITRRCVHHGNWDSVSVEIDSAKNIGFDFLYVDDGISEPYKIITKQKIDSVAAMVHGGTWKQLVVAEYDQTRMSYAKIQDSTRYYGFFNNVDIIMPYKYTFNPTQLNSFFSWISSNFTTNLIPALGYHADVDQSHYDQLSSAYIAVAGTYSNLIFFYTDAEAGYGYFDELTSYLQAYYGM